MRLGIQSARAKWINEYAAPWKLITFCGSKKKEDLEVKRRTLGEFSGLFFKGGLGKPGEPGDTLTFAAIPTCVSPRPLAWSQFGQLFPLLLLLLLSFFQQFLHLPPMLDGLQTSLLCSQLLKPGILSELSQQLWKHQNQNHLLSLTLFMQEDDIGFWHFN